MVQPRDDQLLRLAHLIVSVFELGTRKAERDVLDDLCSHFSLDLASIECTVKRGVGRRAHVRYVTELRERVALGLADAASSPEVLMSAVSRLGKPFIAMLEDIYALLTKAGATTSGTSDNLRLRLGDVDLDLPLSPAFFERVRKLVRLIVNVALGRIDDDAIARMLVVDGDFYGAWSRRPDHPVRDFTYLPWLCSEADRLRSSNYEGWNQIAPGIDQVCEAAESFVEEVVRLIELRAEWVRGDAPKDLIAYRENEDRCDRSVDAEAELFRRTGLLRSGIFAQSVSYHGHRDRNVDHMNRQLHVRVEAIIRGPHGLGSAPNCLVACDRDLLPHF